MQYSDYSENQNSAEATEAPSGNLAAPSRTAPATELGAEAKSFKTKWLPKECPTTCETGETGTSKVPRRHCQEANVESRMSVPLLLRSKSPRMALAILNPAKLRSDLSAAHQKHRHTNHPHLEQ